MYVGFEIEIESSEKGQLYPIHDLIEKAYPMTGWSKHQGISSYHGFKCLSQQGLWRVEADASLYNGAEFIMPPVDKNTSFDLLERFFKLIEDSECSTSDRCGLHLNISNDTRTIDNADLGYFVTNTNYRLLAKLWPDRVKQYNAYSIGLKHILSNMVYNKSINVNTRQQKAFQKEILREHNYMINVRFNGVKTIKERFEIRAMGGENYHKKLEEIKITTNMFEDLLKKSCEPVQNTNKKIISYINRIHERRKLEKYVWIPKIGFGTSQNTNDEVIYKLRSIKNIHEYGAWQFLDKINAQYNRFIYKQFNNKPFDAYFTLMLQAVNNVIYHNIEQLRLRSDDLLNNKIIKLTNEAIYHIVKYMSNNPTVFSSKICNKIIKKYMTGRIKIKDNKKELISGRTRSTNMVFTTPENEKINESRNNKLILTIPKDEKQHDILWLARHMHMFGVATRREYINKLNIHAINFINKHKEKYGKGILRMSQKRRKELNNEK